MEHPPLYLQRCWACSYSLFVKDSTGRRYPRAVEYERILELIESIEGPFSIMHIWEESGRQLWSLNITRNVIRDLRYHNLIRCVRPTRDGKCLAWEKV